MIAIGSALVSAGAFFAGTDYVLATNAQYDKGYEQAVQDLLGR